ncbi:MAG: glutamate formimidoyltransferase [Bacteroidetes bacterium]|nr:glutamate formimidoyltransferase [Bacteroidota bacterium]MBS1629874.1 glutamate formimidoyltransferase [Bacteroidota bacterium]
MSQQAILECVPNFSEGRRPEVIEALADAVRSVQDACLLHVDPSPAANRTVLTFAGPPTAVTEAAYRAIAKAAERIDMRSQEGVHPRIGATDVCPLIPLTGMSMEEADACARALGQRVAAELNIPVYLYEHSATAPYRRALPDIRKGQYEGLAEKMKRPEWKPDFGPDVFNPACGATIIGARNILVAFNISLETAEVSTALHIASRLRASGHLQSGQRIPGLLPMTRSIGWFMADYNQVQVSFNLLDYTVTSPLQAFEACRQAAAELGVRIAGSEVIGLIPEICMLEAGRFALRHQGLPSDAPKEVLAEEAIRYLGLNRLKAFNPQQKILEWSLAHAGLYL